MTLQLSYIPNYLETLANQLGEDYDIKHNIIKLITDARNVSATFHDAMQLEGNNVLHERSALVLASHPGKVNVQNLKVALNALQKRLQLLRDGMFVFQGHVHKHIELCRERSKQHRHTIEIKNIDITRLKSEIKNLEERIRGYEENAAREERNAVCCEEEAKEKSKQSDKHVAAGVGGSLILAGMGVVAAPFSGGASLFLVGGAVGNLGGNAYFALKCSDEAMQHRRNADENRRKAEQYRQTKRSLEYDIATKETDVRRIKEKNNMITTASKVLKDIEQQLYRAVDILNAVIQNMQNLDTTLFDAERQGDAFKIIQTAFGKRPEKLEGRAHYYLNELKARWESVEKDIQQAQVLHSIRK